MHSSGLWLHFLFLLVSTFIYGLCLHLIAHAQESTELLGEGETKQDLCWLPIKVPNLFIKRLVRKLPSKVEGLETRSQSLDANGVWGLTQWFLRCFS